MVRRRFFPFLLFPVALLVFVQAYAQSSTQTNQANPPTQSAAAPEPPMPKDPKELMQLASRVNGLGSLDKPWHLKADYQTFDADGKPKDKGVFEEWWAGPEKYKVSYTSSGFNQVLYCDGDKRATTGDAGGAPLQERMIEEYLVHPLPSEKQVQAASYRENNQKVGKVALRCIEPLPSAGQRPMPGPSYCYSPDMPLLRLESPQENVFVLFNDAVLVHGHDPAKPMGQYAAKKILVENGNLSIVSANVTSLDFPPALQDADLAVPATATFVPPLSVDSSVIAGHRISGEDIHYSSIAKQQWIQGTVMLDAVISKTGTITDLQVISGPPALRQSSVDAVKTWKYQPYLLNGEPVEVSTEITVVYTLGR